MANVILAVAAARVMHQTFDRAWDIISEDEEYNFNKKTLEMDIINRAIEDELDNYARGNDLTIAWIDRRMIRKLILERLANCIGLETLIKLWFASPDCTRENLLAILDAANTVRRIEEQGP